MISRIRGTLLSRDIERVEIMTSGGVAYQVEIPLSVFEALPREGAEVELRTRQVVREDSVTLFGFKDERERELFGRLLGAPGVGPRLALTMISTLAADRLVSCIVARDVDSLRRIPGIGRKTAEKLVVELADKLDDLAVAGATSPAGAAAEQAVGALVSLGYAQVDASAAVRRALDGERTLEGPALIKAALGELSG